MTEDADFDSDSSMMTSLNEKDGLVARAINGDGGKLIGDGRVLGLGLKGGI